MPIRKGKNSDESELEELFLANDITRGNALKNKRLHLTSKGITIILRRHLVEGIPPNIISEVNLT